eukprot:CAMPEP_0183330050 /NCGR_PEP_ID=MMETSP0160_2-20130417/85105_1 /TAXON_ID=2839 ORGANISM="Odontella Sinensis, Strain Grunow 1884" /NCGR_SAMPLE_ID=MMETSP0160_2 /ASSEMBLY_ACC=CAM_ASM_000250 /LENGTH=80 /DNA_ID=CAMNT_0025498251 /DNA_START=40 /DNA_END=282 /DNA_ORIENTATION=+
MTPRGKRTPLGIAAIADPLTHFLIRQRPRSSLFEETLTPHFRIPLPVTPSLHSNIAAAATLGWMLFSSFPAERNARKERG